MSLDLTVITRDRISGKTSDNLDKLLVKSGFQKDKFGFTSIDNEINVNLYVHMKFDEDNFWDSDEVKAIGFEPESEIIIESFHHEKSHEKAYRTALKLAKALNGSIYDHQVGVFYEMDGRPYGHIRKDGKFEELGAGANLHLEAVRIVRDLKPES